MFKVKLFAIVWLAGGTLINCAPVTDEFAALESDLFANKQPPPVTVLKFINEPFTPASNQYKFEYRTSDGQGREEVGKIVKNKNGDEVLYVRGSYSYIGPDDIVYTVFYTADENGFQATGDHIPGKENELPVVQIDRNAIISLLG